MSELKLVEFRNIQRPLVIQNQDGREIAYMVVNEYNFGESLKLVRSIAENMVASYNNKNEANSSLMIGFGEFLLGLETIKCSDGVRRWFLAAGDGSEFYTTQEAYDNYIKNVVNLEP